MAAPFVLLLLANRLAATPPPDDKACTAATRNALVHRAFLAIHDGWSTDEVLLQTELNDRFLAECRRVAAELDGDVPPTECNWRLINLRKAGKLTGVPTTRSRRDDPDEYRHIAEMVARFLQDKHRVSTDRLMCDPVLRSEFDKCGQELCDVEPYLLRKAAFGLRKIRQLQPELVLRIADWGRQIEVHRVCDLGDESLAGLSDGPGVYIFRDASGYLYVGESKNLRRRLISHFEESDRLSLANYLDRHREKQADSLLVELHIFPKDSRARQVRVRRAYESQLIASRKPRFNVRP